MALEVTDATFDEVVLKSDKPVMVDFWAAWCGPCRMVAPIMDQISEEYEGKAIVAKVDVDNNQEFAAKFGIRNIPTVLIFNKKIVDGLCQLHIPLLPAIFLEKIREWSF